VNRVRSFQSSHITMVAPHGQKRRAEDEIENQANISTHFKKLRIRE